ncbi:MAG: pyruvate kinase, partial [Candidatus Omnitrophica bacterium]|nr:pyruvate kinase [Candidatus Omnitrophota bacterium]
MMLAGMDVARLNFSHGKTKKFLYRIELIRRINAKYRRRIKILGDLQGHRIRIGDLDAPFELKKRRTVRLTQQKLKGTPELISFDYQGPLQTVKNGSRIFIDDGNIALEVIGRTKNSLMTKINSRWPA